MVQSQRKLIFYVNGTKFELEQPDPRTTLLQFLRGIGLTGTKLGCAEGGCGACTVLVSNYDIVAKRPHHISVNACLMPLCSLHHKHVITVEGIGTSKQPHPVQERIAKFFGSQCGFCTPGIVMSLYALLRNNPKPTEAEIEEAFDGNLCRCTGYRSILTAAKTFCNDKCGKNGYCVYDGNAEKGKPMFQEEIQFKKYDASQELIFPPGLIRIIESEKNKQSFEFEKEGHKWFRPVTLQELLRLKAKYPAAKLVNGNTEVGIEVKFKNQEYNVMISPTDIPELIAVNIRSDGLEVGACVTLSDFWKELAKQIDSLPEYKTRGFKSIIENLRWFAGRQIRNVGTLAGNIATASPISDLNPVLVSLKCTLKLQEEGKDARLVTMENFFQGYRKTALQTNEVIVSLFVPFTHENEYCMAYKQAKRRDDDIAIVTAGFRVVLNQDQVVQDCSFAFGGMGPYTIDAQESKREFIGKKWSQEVIEKLNPILISKDVFVPFSAPGGMAEYRRTLAQGFLYKFYNFVCERLKLDYEKSSVVPKHRPLTSGIQIYNDSEGKGLVGKSIIHLSALKQVTGEAVYTDDIPLEKGELFAAFVYSKQPYAKITKVDESEALNMKGVVSYVDHRDVKGNNIIGPVFKDEELFAKEYVYFHGQIIGMVVAESRELAQAAAKKVVVGYSTDNLPLNNGKAIITIEEAIKHQSYFPITKKIIKGNVEEAFAKCDYVISGEHRIGGQNHFYLETQASIAIPGREDDEMEIISSTQNPTETQHLTAHVLGISSNRVVVKVKRMGGGFGGKETRSAPISCALAVAARKCGKRVRIMLDREEDMVLCGQRHPFSAKYKVGFEKSGKILALDLELYSNGGYSADLSLAVMERAISHSDNCYYIPNVRAVGRVCKTNIHSNTAFRGFGGPQGMIFTEVWMDRVALKLNVPLEKVREINFYSENQTTHFNQPLTDFHIPKMCAELKQQSDFINRREAVEKFNAENKYVKRGIVVTPTKFGISFTARFLNQAGALVHIYSDGSVLLSHAGTEMGQGLHTKMVQVLADALYGFDPKVNSVHISDTSTDKVPNTSPTAASAGSDLNGMAIKNACDQLNERLKPLFNKHPEKSFAEIVKMAYFERVNLSANGFYKTPDLDYNWEDGTGKRMFNYFTFGCAVNEVQVDCLTGDYQILRSDMMMDLGNSLNPMIDIGQIEGAFVQGLGMTTMEESLWFPNNGQLITRGPGMYKIPSFTDIPIDFRVHLFDTRNIGGNKFAVYSSKAVGEPPLFLGAGVYFAVYEAVRAYRKQNNLDTDFRLDSPATSERIRMACQDTFTAVSVAAESASQRGTEWCTRA